MHSLGLARHSFAPCVAVPHTGVVPCPDCARCCLAIHVAGSPDSASSASTRSRVVWGGFLRAPGRP
eukprot:9329459-Alexandrium_andersonii.AAC.1